jgi:hypothetical protein
MKLMLAVLALATVCCTLTPQPVAPGGAPTMSDPAVVKLLMTDQGQCTAWKIGANLVATAGHCCEEGSTYTAEGPHSVAHREIKVLVDDDEHDICIMEGPIDGRTIALASGDPAVGETVWTTGYPRGTFLISDGYWSGRDEDGDGVCSVVVNPGASGSPILNLRGEAIGILVRYRPGMDNLAFVTSLDVLRANLLKAQKLL